MSMASTRTTFTLDSDLAERARQLDINNSAIDCDEIQTVRRSSLTTRVGSVTDTTMHDV
jgi:post-segregation antitoxin (ccd killing protein)